MRKVYQKVFDSKTGDCFSACLATLLNLELEDVPNFMLKDGHIENATKWLQDNHGLSLAGLLGVNADGTPGGMLTNTPVNPELLCIGAFQSPNFVGGKHAAVIRMFAGEYGCEVVHDPAPYGNPLEGHPERIYLLLPHLEVL